MSDFPQICLWRPWKIQLHQLQTESIGRASQENTFRYINFPNLTLPLVPAWSSGLKAGLPARCSRFDSPLRCFLTGLFVPNLKHTFDFSVKKWTLSMINPVTQRALRDPFKDQWFLSLTRLFGFLNFGSGYRRLVRRKQELWEFRTQVHFTASLARGLISSEASRTQNFAGSFKYKIERIRVLRQIGERAIWAAFQYYDMAA